MRPVSIAPSILAADLGHLAEQVAAATQAGAQQLHVDVMDGHFVPNLSFGAGVVAAVRRATTAFVDTHLMIEAPERWVDVYADAGSDGITVHAEATPHLHRALQAVRDRDLKVGVAVNPLTPLSVVEAALDEVDLVLIMSVDPGFGGQRYLPGSDDRLATVRRWIDQRGLAVRLQVDGGIDAGTAPRAAAAGADSLVAGNAVFGAAGGAAAGMAALRQALDSSMRPI